MSGENPAPAAQAEPQIVPTIGRIVWYRMSVASAIEINQRRKDAMGWRDWFRALKPGAQVHVGNQVQAGDLYPAMIVRTWGDTPTSCVQLQVFLDGNDTFWATSVNVGTGDGTYQWMPYQKGQAAKTEAAEAAARQQ